MRFRATAAAAFSLCLAGCGGADRASSPLGASGSSLQLVSGETGAPVSGAAVSLGGRTLRSDAAGWVDMGLAAGGALDVAAEQFLLRETRLGPERTLFLWPTGPTYSGDYVRRLLYKPSVWIGDPATAADAPLMRVVDRRVDIVPDAALWADPAALTAHHLAIAEINAATAGLVRFELVRTPSASVAFRAYVDPTTTLGSALTWRDLRDHAIVGGRIAYADLRWARDPHFVLHELGHALGLQHSMASDDVMYRIGVAGLPYRFGANERLSIRLLLLRSPGNQYPDNDRGTGPVRAAGPGAGAMSQTIN